jgi:adenylate cyclase
MKKWIVTLVLLLSVVGLRYSDPWILETVRMKALDVHQQNQETVILEDIVTVEIDNKTMDKNGQWPWPREIMQRELIKLFESGAGLVVMPILFSQPDRGGKDKEFAELLAQLPVVIGQIPANEAKGNPVPRGVAVIGGNGEDPPWTNWIYEYNSAVGPVKEIGDVAAGVGMMSSPPESDGVLRRLPLVVQINNQLFPSISLETLRVAAGDPSYQMKASGEAGVEALRIPKFSKIITDANGSIWIDFQYKTKTMSLADIDPNAEESFVQGKIVILSPTASGIDNPVATPVGVLQGHDVIATSIATMMAGTNITRPWWSDFGELAAVAIGSIILAAAVLSLSWWFSLITPVLVVGSFFGSSYLFTQYGFLVDWSYPALGMFFVWAIAAFMRFMDEYKQKMEIKKQFAGYCSPTVVRMLQENPALIKEGMKREISICFSDLRGFTPLGESFGDDVKGLTQLMNGYMDAITQPVLDADGMIIKYIGDASMHVHNAPNDDPNHEHSAVKTGLNMLEAVEKFNDKITAEGRPPIGMGAGINSGLGYLGEMGSTSRHSYDVLGDAISTAARIESKCKEYGCLLLVGETTYDKTKDDFFYLKVDELAVKGKSVGIRIYTVLSEMEWAFENTNWDFAQQQHEKMHELYKAQQFDAAIRFCQDLYNEFDGKMQGYYDMWIERCEFMKTQPLEDDWNGVFIATTK